MISNIISIIGKICRGKRVGLSFPPFPISLLDSNSLKIRSLNRSTFSTKQQKQPTSPLIKLKNATITLPNDQMIFKNTCTIEIYGEGGGGEEEEHEAQPKHFVIFGDNGSGKSSLAKAFGGILETQPKPETVLNLKRHVAHLNFEQHRIFLEQNQNKTVAEILGGVRDGLVRQIIVQLGLYPVFSKPLAVLSTGEIRKVLLAIALSKRPRVLILEKPFDGLDRDSRAKLIQVMDKMCKGFSRLLVDIGSSTPPGKVQLVLVTHRLEEIPKEITSGILVKDLNVAWQGKLEQFKHDENDNDYDSSMALSSLLSHRTNRKSLPSSIISDDNSIFNHNQYKPIKGELIAEFNFTSIFKGEQNFKILDNINWRLKQGASWMIHGHNGAGKSTIIKLLAGIENDDTVKVFVDNDKANISVVSTEMHLKNAKQYQDLLVKDIIFQQWGGENGDEKYKKDVLECANLLGLTKFLDIKFGNLSQGFQKLVLIHEALVSRPRILIMDEVCQGLDSYHRSIILDILTCLCYNTHTSIIYVTHHEDEILESFTNNMTIEGGKIISLFSE